MADYAGIGTCPRCGPWLDDHGKELETELVDVSLVYPHVVVMTSVEVPTDDDYIANDEVIHRTAHFLAGEFGVEVDLFYPGLQDVSINRRDC
jgi:hypothetical protein